MSIKGNMETREALVGNIHLLKKIPGYSAYEIAVKHGFKGTEAEWLISISAYGIAVKLGFEGTVEEWIASLKGEKGDIGNVELHGGIDALGERIKNVADPVDDGDAVNKKYADDAIAEKVSEGVTAANGYAEEKFVPLAYEDISESFIVNDYGSTISSCRVFKQGNVISGSITVKDSFSGTEPIIKINSDYSPRCDVLVITPFAQDAEGNVIAANYIALLMNGAIVVQECNTNVATHFFSFTYICK